MSRTSRIAFALPLLALACAKPTAAIEPEADPAAAQAEQQRAAVESAAAAQARFERLSAWTGENVEGERYLVPIAPDDVSYGAGPDARVTFVVFLDYQCPYSLKLDAELHKLVETYPTDVRVVVKQFPLATHDWADIAAEFVVAAASQGYGQAMHERMFAAAGRLSDEALGQIVLATQLPDPDRFWIELGEGRYIERVEQDKQLAARLGVGSTPSYFVNGVPQRGFKDFSKLRELYMAELEVADRVLAAGATRTEIYDLLMANAAPEREPPPRPPSKADAGPRPGKPDPALSYAVPVDGRPTRGSDDALVTIIEFADFECPYCEKVQPTLRELEKRYGKELRVVYRHQPLPMHKSADEAALAAAAADRQGEFWAMHDLLFAASKEQLADPNFYTDAAAQLGLDVARFKQDLRDPKLAELIAEDQKVAAQFGAGGTPAFFINGRYLGGAQPVANFAALIDEELVKAREYAKQHKVAANKLYATMAKGWETKVEVPPIADHTRRVIDVSGLPGKGKLNKPKITMVMCGDFDCPYTAKGAQLVEQILADPKYANKVGFYFMHFPLPMHAQAMGAHQAAIAAGSQGKFWEMHDLLFADRQRRGQAEYEAMAGELGLDVAQFRADWASQATRDAIDEAMAACTKLGVSGTPNFFINGRLMRGAVPFASTSEVLDEELAGGFEAKAKAKTKSK